MPSVRFHNLVLEDLCAEWFTVDYSHPQTIQQRECVLHYSVIATLKLHSFMRQVLYVCRASLQTRNGLIYGWMDGCLPTSDQPVNCIYSFIFPSPSSAEC